jgi:hypothetical protein
VNRRCRTSISYSFGVTSRNFPSRCYVRGLCHGNPNPTNQTLTLRQPLGAYAGRGRDGVWRWASPGPRSCSDCNANASLVSLHPTPTQSLFGGIRPLGTPTRHEGRRIVFSHPSSIRRGDEFAQGILFNPAEVLEDDTARAVRGGEGFSGVRAISFSSIAYDADGKSVSKGTRSAARVSGSTTFATRDRSSCCAGFRQCLDAPSSVWRLVPITRSARSEGRWDLRYDDPRSRCSG